MAKQRILAACAAVSICASGLALAQATPSDASRFTIYVPQTQTQSENGFILGQNADQMLGSNLMDVNVVGAGGERIGPVEDLLIDRQGRILGVVVEVGGFLGIGQRQVAVSIDQVEFVLADAIPAGSELDEGSQIQNIVLGFTREQLEDAPEFTRFGQDQ